LSRPVLRRGQTYELLAENRDVLSAPSPPVEQSDLSAARTAVCEFLDRALPHVPDPALPGGRDRFQEKLLAAAHLRTLDGPAVTVRLLSQLESRPNATLKTWRDRGMAKMLAEEYDELRTSVVAPALTRWREYVYPIAIEPVGPA